MKARARAHDPSCIEAPLEVGTAWEGAHVALKNFVRRRSAGEYEEAQLILAAFRCQVHLMLGFASFVEYLDRHAGYSGRAATERLRVAQALETLPLIAGALRDGELCWSAVRELTRVAVPSTEAEWLAEARGRCVRFIEQRVTGLSPGDRPGTVPPPGARHWGLHFEVTAETMAIFREAQAHIRREAGGGLDDDAVLFAMCRAVLGGSRDEGRSSYQLAVMICPACNQARMAAAGAPVEVDETVRAMVECDANVVQVDTGPEVAHFHREDGPLVQVEVGAEGRFCSSRTDDAGPPTGVAAAGSLDALAPAPAGAAPDAPRWLALDRDAHVGAVSERRVAPSTQAGQAASLAPDAGARAAASRPARDRGVHVGRERMQPATQANPVVPEAGAGGGRPRSAPDVSRRLVPDDPSQFTPEGGASHTGREGGQRRPRASQTVPPAVRRHVLLRDGHRCVVTGCRSSLYLDIHHLILRSEGGGHDPDALITLCGAHHRAQHGGRLIVEGTPSSGLVFRHADGTTYGQEPTPALTTAMRDVFLALRHLGYAEGESKTALAAVRASMPAVPTETNILRAALATLRATKLGASAARGGRQGRLLPRDTGGAGPSGMRP